jgi:hypothetical protein
MHSLGSGRIIVEDEQTPAGPLVRIPDRLTGSRHPEGSGGVEPAIVPLVRERQTISPSRNFKSGMP